MQSASITLTWSGTPIERDMGILVECEQATRVVRALKLVGGDGQHSRNGEANCFGELVSVDLRTILAVSL